MNTEYTAKLVLDRGTYPTAGFLSDWLAGVPSDATISFDVASTAGEMGGGLLYLRSIKATWEE